ncbi:hypothetical protein V5799_033589 [Amblyomma americanum]|uniref:Uncharacterized protein n=1 Tax=Amblyomma americanum TaxID=6943 RepID=A0AAQ4DMW4_AMBAM
MGPNAAAVAAGRHKRDSDTLREILIEHVNNVDEPQAALSLFIGFLILGAIVIVVLIFLGCLLLLRFSESRSAKYHRLCSQESLGSLRRSRIDNTGPSQVFTYVDLSNADGGCLNHRSDCEHAQAPRFSTIFTTVSNAGAKNTESRREPKRRRSSGARASRLLAMGLPSLISAADTPSLRRVRSQEDSINSSDADSVAAAERMAEPPKKRVCVQQVTGMPTQRSGSVNTAEGLETYGERYTELESGAPQMEVKVRDRLVKRLPHGTGTGQEWSPFGSGLAQRADETASGSTTATQNRYYPEGTSNHGYESSLRPHRQPGSWSEMISPLFSPDGTATGPPLFPNQPKPIALSDNATEDRARLRPERMELSGHGRFYEKHVPVEDSNAGATSEVKPCLSSGTNSGTAIIPYEDSLQRPISAVKRTSDNEIRIRNGVPAPSSNSERFHNMLENEASDVKQDLMSSQKPDEKSASPVTPVKIKANLTLQRVTSHVPSTVGSPEQSEPKELSVQLPEMIAYFDKPHMAKSFKATIDAGSASNVATKVSSPDAQWMTPPVAEDSGSPSSSDRKTQSRKLKLPQPPIERRGELQTVPPPSEMSALVSRSPPSARKEPDARGSTQSHSLDDVSHQRAPLSHTFSESDVRSGDVDKRKVFATSSALAPRSGSSLVASDSQPSRETMLAVNTKQVEPRSTYGLPGSRHSPSDDVAKAPDKNGQPLSIPAEDAACENNVSTGSPSAKVAAEHVGKAPRNLQSPKGSTPPVGPAHADVSPLQADPIALKAEITVDGAWPIATAGSNHIQPFNLNEAIVEGPTLTEVAKRDHGSSIARTHSSAVECAPDKKILDKENPQPLEPEFNEGESKLTPVTRKTEQNPEHAQGQQLVAEPVDRATIEPRSEDTHFLVRHSSQGSSSGAELTEQPTLPPNHTTGQTSSKSLTNASVDGHQVAATSPVHQTELVSLSPSSSHTDGTIARLKPSEIQASGASRALATSGEMGLEVTPSGVSADSRELATLAAYQATLVSPTSSQSGGAVDLRDQSRSSALQSAESSRGLAVSDTRAVTSTIHDVTAGQKISSSEQSAQDTTVATREDRPGPSRVEDMNSLPLKERTDSNDVFFGAASPVASQGSKDLISFNPEQTNIQQKESAPDVPTGAEGRNKRSPPQNSSSNEDSSK